MLYKEAIEWCETHEAHVIFKFDYVWVGQDGQFGYVLGPTFLTAVMKAMKLEEDNETN